MISCGTSEQWAVGGGPSAGQGRNADRPGYKKTPVGWIPEVGRPFLADSVRHECLTYNERLVGDGL